MPDYTLPPAVTLIFGQSGSGKTTFAFRYLLNLPAACRFVFDWKGEAARRLKLKACNTQADCEAALPARWVILNPLAMWQGADIKEAFRWFCRWAFEVSRRGPGKKVFFCDELWRFTDARTLPDELENIVRAGRVENLELCTCTQHPRDYHRDLRAEVTEWVCFNTVEESDLDAVRQYFAGVDRVADLARGSFIAYNRESGGELAGKMF